MTYFADLTPHTYVKTADTRTVLNIGWLSDREPFPRGDTSAEFREKLKELCQHPIHRHRGFHECDLCPAGRARARGNGQIRVVGRDGMCYAAPTLIEHYVESHGYCPPLAFIDAVVNGTPAPPDAEL